MFSVLLIYVLEGAGAQGGVRKRTGRHKGQSLSKKRMQFLVDEKTKVVAVEIEKKVDTPDT